MFLTGKTGYTRTLDVVPVPDPYPQVRVDPHTSTTDADKQVLDVYVISSYNHMYSISYGRLLSDRSGRHHWVGSGASFIARRLVKLVNVYAICCKIGATRTRRWSHYVLGELYQGQWYFK